MLKKFLTISLLLLLISFSSACVPGDWHSAASYVNSRIVRVEHPVDLLELYLQSTGAPDIFMTPDGGAKAVCTGFVINEFKEYVLTANHCAGKDMTADGKQATIVWANEEQDL